MQPWESKLKMFIVIHPTYGTHTNELNQWRRSGDLNQAAFVFSFTAVILFLFVKMINMYTERQVGKKGEGGEEKQTMTSEHGAETCFHTGLCHCPGPASVSPSVTWWRWWPETLRFPPGLLPPDSPLWRTNSQGDSATRIQVSSTPCSLHAPNFSSLQLEEEKRTSLKEIQCIFTQMRS